MYSRQCCHLINGNMLTLSVSSPVTWNEGMHSLFVIDMDGNANSSDYNFKSENSFLIFFMVSV